MTKKFNEFVEIISEATRESGESISNSLKSIYSRAVNAELSAIGIDTSNKDAETVVMAFAKVWDSLSESTKLKMSEDIAGKYNLSKFYVLMDQLSEVKSQ
ncbi:hypothetical protein [Bacillus infantis]|uniref:hypothetical protein n=1 Tax=Bacillus infantis TaxID=324767 RepID=UPI003CF39F6E